MDFWQLDDIFELLGQNESLHVFCLSLSPPQRLPLGIPKPILRTTSVWGSRESARLLTLFLPYAKPILKKTRTVLQSTTRRT